jgi:hypothetical protein
MTYYDTQQQNPLHNQQFNPQQAAAAFGSGLGWGQQPQWGGQQQQPQWGGQQWGGQQQRQLSQQDLSEVVRQLVPALPQMLAQAQQPHAAFGYAAYGQTPGYGGYGQQQRQLSQQDVNEVVRQILPIVPQIVGALQGQPHMQYAAMQGGLGMGQFGQGYPQSYGAQFGGPQFQSAFGASGQQQRQLTQQDVADVTRQLIGVIPQVIGNLQAFNQQRMI